MGKRTLTLTRLPYWTSRVTPDSALDPLINDTLEVLKSNLQEQRW